MSIWGVNQVLDRYDAEHDAHFVTWADAELAESVKSLQEQIEGLKQEVAELKAVTKNESAN